MIGAEASYTNVRSLRAADARCTGTRKFSQFFTSRVEGISHLMLRLFGLQGSNVLDQGHDEKNGQAHDQKTKVCLDCSACRPGKLTDGFAVPAQRRRQGPVRRPTARVNFGVSDLLAGNAVSW